MRFILNSPDYLYMSPHDGVPGIKRECISELLDIEGSVDDGYYCVAWFLL